MEKRKRGRPTDPHLNDKVLKSTIIEITKKGLKSCNIEAIAKRCHITKPTIYRRWSTKKDLIHDAVFSIQETHYYSEDKSLEENLAIWVNTLATHIEEFPSSVISFYNILSAAEKQNPELIGHIRSNVLVPRRKTLETIILRGIDEGTFRSVQNIEVVISMAIGALYSHHVTTEEISSKEMLELIISTLLELLKK